MNTCHHLHCSRHYHLPPAPLQGSCTSSPTSTWTSTMVFLRSAAGESTETPPSFGQNPAVIFRCVHSKIQSPYQTYKALPDFSDVLFSLPLFYSLHSSYIISLLFFKHIKNIPTSHFYPKSSSLSGTYFSQGSACSFLPIPSGFCSTLALPERPSWIALYVEDLILLYFSS